MGDVIRLPVITDFPFMPAQNVNMGSVLGHLSNFLQVYNGPSEFMWTHFESDLREHISGFSEMIRDPGKRKSIILTILAQNDMGEFQYSVKLRRAFFKR